ncbi:MAG TPA: sigma-70 family RNA polymerase sigma factor [bacterium]|nr:sigma-70 family RNA polymerase sigma factor [bacterium]
MNEGEDLSDIKVFRLLSQQSLSTAEAKLAADILYKEFIPKIIGVLVKSGAERILAEDMAKTAVYKAIVCIKTYNPTKAKLITWVTKIAINLFFDKCRAGRNIDTYSLNNSTIADEPVPDDEKGEPKQMEKLKDCVQKLSKDDQLLIQYELYRTKNEFLEEFHITDDTYRTRKSRALQQLRLLVKDKG